ncbi:hypothetical protein [Streptosporangium sp. H16]|uniref:hypothetical protein n=1 Tax=Streptosporangium sp. H16 TaxID=3444184 RepID=UPI003F7B1CA9
MCRAARRLCCANRWSLDIRRLPSLRYLRPLGALAVDGFPLHHGGSSTTHPGLVYLGLEFQRSFASSTLRAVSRDAAYVVGPLVAHASNAPAAVGL